VIYPIANKGSSLSGKARPRPSGRQDSLHEAARIQQKLLAKAEIIVGSANKLWRMRLAPLPFFGFIRFVRFCLYYRVECTADQTFWLQNAKRLSTSRSELTAVSSFLSVSFLVTAAVLDAPCRVWKRWNNYLSINFELGCLGGQYILRAVE
jgi:hypothetical protein